MLFLILCARYEKSIIRSATIYGTEDSGHTLITHEINYVLINQGNEKKTDQYRVTQSLQYNN